MSEEMNKVACSEREEEIRLFLWNELDEDGSDALEMHLESCGGCRDAVESERQLLAVLQSASPPDPPMELLAQCRVDLSEKIDQAGLPGFWTRLGTVIWPRGLRWSFRGWMTAHPAFSAAVLVMAGIAMGGILPRLVTAPPENNGVAQSTVVATPASTPVMNVTGIEADGGRVVFRGNEETAGAVGYDVNDPRTLKMLVDVLQNGQQFTADTRMTSVVVLQGLTSKQEARETLCNVARTDRNPAVRLKAVEALKGMGDDEHVRKTILEALLQDENPGVRIEAVNALREMVEAAPAPDRELMRVLRERMEKDPNTYIRVQSAAAVRSAEQRGIY